MQRGKGVQIAGFMQTVHRPLRNRLWHEYVCNGCTTFISVFWTIAFVVRANPWRKSEEPAAECRNRADTAGWTLKVSVQVLDLTVSLYVRTELSILIQQQYQCTARSSFLIPFSPSFLHVDIQNIVVVPPISWHPTWRKSFYRLPLR